MADKTAKVSECTPFRHKWMVEEDIEDDGTRYVFDKSQHCVSLLHNLDYMRARNIFLDIELVSGDMQAVAFHGVLLAAVASKFREILSHPCIDYMEGRLSPKSATGEILKLLVNYIYKSYAVIDSEEVNWTSVLDFCSIFGIYQIVSAENDCSVLLDTLKDMHDKNEMCFTVIHTRDGGEFLVHAPIIAASSPLMLQEMAPLHIPPCVERITFEHVDSATISSIMDFIYTATVSITNENVQNLLLFSSVFRYSSVEAACCHFLLLAIRPHNALGIRYLMDKCFSEEEDSDSIIHESAEKVDSYIIQNILQISQNEEFEILPTAHNILEYLSQAYVPFANMDDLVHACVRWYNHNIKDRLTGFLQIIMCITILYKSDIGVPVLGDVKSIIEKNNDERYRSSLQCLMNK